MLTLHVQSASLPTSPSNMPPPPPIPRPGDPIPTIAVPNKILFQGTTLRATAIEAMKVKGLRWEGPPAEASSWIVCGLRVNGMSWLKVGTESGIPADAFSMEALISRFVEFGELIVGDTIEIDVANGGEDSKVFAASFVGTPC